MATAVILAGGIGRRMGQTNEPKQYMRLGEAPVIVHTIDQFILNKDIKNIIVLVPEDWVTYTKDLINKYSIKTVKDIYVEKGGAERSETLYIGCKKAIEINGEVTKIVSHDAVRPFISQRIIDDNIRALDNHEAINTIIPSPDTIVKVSSNEELIEEIPVRKQMYLGQTPQSFMADKYVEIYDSMDEKQLASVTDACKMFVDQGISVGYVLGDQKNMKITTLFDYNIASILLSNGEKND